LRTLKDVLTIKILKRFGDGLKSVLGPRLEQLIDWFDGNKEAVEAWGKKLEEMGRKVGMRVTGIIDRVKALFQGISGAPGFDEMSWSEKVIVALEKILEAVTAWLKGPGGEAIKKTGETLGSLLAAGLEGAIPNIVPVAVNLGLSVGKGILSGIWEALTSNPIVGALLGALGGAKIGAMAGSVFGLPGVAVGAVGGAIVGGGIAAIRRARKEARENPTIPSERIPNPVISRATGGIYSRPHTALVAEAGPEAIIPLSIHRRSRALRLWEETGRRLGVRPYAEGGVAGPVPVAVPAMAGSGAPTARAPISVTNYIDVSVGGSNADPDRIAEAIAVKIERVFSNIPQFA